MMSPWALRLGGPEPRGPHGVGAYGDSLPKKFDICKYLNTGQVNLMPVTFQGSSGTGLFRQMALLIHQHIARFHIVVSAGIAESFCRSWYKSQPSQQNITNIIDEVSRRSPCPPTIFPITLNQMTNFKIDSSCNPANPRLSEFFHPSANVCYRSTNNGGGYVAQCCYNSDNRLILGLPGGGTILWVDSDIGVFGHFLSDVSPYIACCKLSSLCSLYYEKRPSIDSRFYVPPRPIQTGGDPHFNTLDGTFYDFNPIGEFIYFKGEGDEIQARISQYLSSTGQRVDACYFSAFAFKSNQSDSIQVELNALQTFTVNVNGVIILLNQGSWNLNNIHLFLANNATLYVHLGTGINFQIFILSRLLQLIISVPNSLKGKVAGLIGNWDDNPENDVMLPDGTWIPGNSSNRDFYFKFGMKWSTTNESSLFFYPDGLIWNDFQNLSFIPSFVIPPPNPVCRNNSACLYDIYVTGDEDVGLSNIVIQNRTEQIVSLFDSMASFNLETISSDSPKQSSTNTRK